MTGTIAPSTWWRAACWCWCWELPLGVRLPGWKKVYLNLMAASGFYAVNSLGVNLAVTNGAYYTGSLYDIPLMAAVSWMAATALTARDWQPEAAPPRGG